MSKQGQSDAFADLDRLADEIERENDQVEVEVETGKERKEKEDAEKAAAIAGAALAVGFAETLVKMKWNYVQINDEVRSAVVEKAAPVVKKYGTELPAWLLPYAAEIELGVVLAAAGVGVYMQVQAHEAEKQRQAQGMKDAVSGAQSEHGAPEQA